MFLNNQKWGKSDETKQFQNRAEYFCSYNQQSHRKLYLKEYSQLRQLVAKYNPAYQDQRKGDRHKLNFSTRYRVKILKKELEKRGWKEINQVKNKENLSSLSFFFFPVVMVEKKFPLISLSYKTFFFDIHTREKTCQKRQEAYLFSYLVQKESGKLKELLFEKPLLFQKRLAELDWQIRNNPVKTWELVEIAPKSKVPPVGYTWKSPHYDKRSLGSLLLTNQVVAWKTDYHPTLDFDLKGLSPQQKEVVEKLIDYLINYWKLPFCFRTPSGGYHLRFNSVVPFASSKLYYAGKETDYKRIVVGDFKARGSYTIHPFSRGYEVVKTKWSRGGKEKIIYFQSKERMAKELKNYGFYFSEASWWLKIRQGFNWASDKVIELGKGMRKKVVKITGKIGALILAKCKLWSGFHKITYQNMENGEVNSVLFNSESNGQKGSWLSFFWKGVPLLLSLKKGEKGSFIKGVEWF